MICVVATRTNSLHHLRETTMKTTTKITEGNTASTAEGKDRAPAKSTILHEEHLALLADVSTSRQGVNTIGDEEWDSSRSITRTEPLQTHISPHHMSTRVRSSTETGENSSHLISRKPNRPVGIKSPRVTAKNRAQKRKNQNAEEQVGPDAIGPRQRNHRLYDNGHWRAHRSADPATQVHADPHASAFDFSMERRSTHDHLQQSPLLSALNSTDGPQLPVSMRSAILNAYAAAIVGPVHPMQPPNLASALALQQATRLDAARQFLSANIAPGSIPDQSGSHHTAVPPESGRFDVHSLTPWMAIQGVSSLSLPVSPALLLQQHLVPNRDVINLYHHQLHLPNRHRPGPSSLLLGTMLGSMPQYSVPPPYYSGLGGGFALHGGGAARQGFAATGESPDPFGPSSLPVLLFQVNDETKLSSYQILLRQQIEAFAASKDDVDSHARGRNKPITMRQVGIRCRHCSRTTWNRRKKGSAYFPHSLQGLYQAAQNMGSSHFNDTICSQMPAELQEKFAVTIACKSSVGSGKHYWAESARKLGLVDTDRGIRTIFDVLQGVP